MMEKIIPVIGVPAQPSAAPKASLETPRLIQPAMKVPVQAKNPPKKAVPKKQKKSVKALEIQNDLITSTGKPANENGNYAKEEENKLSSYERNVMNSYIEKSMAPLKSKNMTPKQTKRAQFKLKLIWLLNKKAMLEAHLKVERIQKTIQKSKETKAKVNEEKEKGKAKNSYASKPKPLMDIVVTQSAKDKGNYDNHSISYYSSRGNEANYESEAVGYQYLDDNWFNADKPWRNFQTSTNPASDFTYLGSSTSSTMNPLSFPLSSSTSSFSQPAPTTFPTSSLSYPLSDPSYPQLSSSSNFNPISMSFNAPPPSFNQVSIPSLIPVEPTPAEFISSYRQQFPVQEQPLNLVGNMSQPSFPIQQQRNPSPFTPTTPDFSSSNALAVSEDELARQRRLIEIEKELQAINLKKIQMQMEAELRERQMEFSHRQQMMQYREREIRDREMIQEHRRSAERERDHSSRHRYDSYGYSSRGSRSPRQNDHSQSRRQESSRSSEYHQHHQRNSSSSNSRQISIERTDNRQGRNEKKRGEGKLKRPAEPGYRQDNNNKSKSGRIQPAKRPRHRQPKVKPEEQILEMQEISDDE